MKRYFNNLLLALLGRDPYQQELDKVKKEYELTAEKVKQLDDMRLQFDEKMSELEAKVSEAEKEVSKAEGKIKDYQNLTENLRRRVTEKDLEIERYKRKLVDRHEEFQERMAERDEKIANLRTDLDGTLAQLEKANKLLAKELMAQSLLEKTNNGLEDLLSAMQSGDVEKIAMAVQYLDWSNPLSRIAQQYLMVLRRRNELVERMHFVENDEEDTK